MSSKIETYLGDLQRRKENHKNYWVIPLSTAYTTAFNKFKATLEADNKKREAQAKLIADLILLGVTLPIGGLLTSRLSFAVLSQTVSSVGIKQLARATIALKGNASAKYIYGEASKWVQKNLKEGVVGGIASGLSRNPLAELQGLYDDPLIFKNNLEAFNLAHANAAGAFAEKVRDSEMLSDEQKDKVAEELRKSAYFTEGERTEKHPHLQNSDGVAKDVELMLWAGYILNTDYWVQDMTGIGFRGSVELKRGSIDQSPYDNDYGTSLPRGNLSQRSLTDLLIFDARVAYEKPGDVVMDRIEALWSERINSKNPFLREAYDRRELQRAEYICRKLSVRYRN